MKIDDMIEELQRIRKMRGNLPVVIRVTRSLEHDYLPVSVDNVEVRYPGAKSGVPVALVKS